MHDLREQHAEQGAGDESRDALLERGSDHAEQPAAEQLRTTQRYTQLQAFDLTQARVRTLARDFVKETLAEWERFRTAGARSGSAR